MPWASVSVPQTVLPFVAIAVIVAASIARVLLGGLRLALRLAVWAAAAVLVASVLLPRASALIVR
jgi:hypothetical protein